MATYDLTRNQLDAALTHNFDAQTRAAILDYLNNAHAFNPTVTVDNQPFPSNSHADVFSVQSTFATVNTDDPPKVIVWLNSLTTSKGLPLWVDRGCHCSVSYPFH
jgi:hypothetical protein